jgi:hypothetical protein
MKLLTILFLAVASSGCAVFTPPMPEPECPDYPSDTLALAVPMPIPDAVFIDIKPGQKATANEGGWNLLKSYADLRERIKRWHVQNQIMASDIVQ